MDMTAENVNEQYWTLRKSTSECATVFGVSAETFRRKMIELGIPRRLKTERFGGWNKGKPSTHEQRAKLSATRSAAFASGQLQHWNLDRHWSEEVRRKISETLLDGRDPSPSYYGQDWRTQRTSRLQIDDFACQECGARNDLEVHHWEPYRFCFDNSLDNLVTLCASCHRDMHKRYKREGWTEEAEDDFYA